MPAVAFLVVAEVCDVDAHDVIRFRKFRSGGGPVAGGSGVVDQFVFVQFAIRTIFELFVEEDIFVAGHLEDRTAGEGLIGSEDLDEIVVAADGPAGIRDHHVEEEFALAGSLAFRAVDGDAAVGSAEESIRGEVEIVAHAASLIAAAFAAFEADARIVVDVAFAVDDGGFDAVIAHDFGGRVHEGAVGIGRDDAEIVPSVGGGCVVIDFAEGTGVRSGGGPEGIGACAVGGPEVVLNDGAGGLAGNDASVLARAGGGHGGRLEGSAID